MPDTREQFKAIRADGGSDVDVSLTDTDLVSDEELLELVEAEIRDIAEKCGLRVRTIIRR